MKINQDQIAGVIDWIETEIEKAEKHEENAKTQGDFETAVRFNVQKLSFERCKAVIENAIG